MRKHQMPDWSILHSPSEMQQLSNLGHQIEGILLLVIALIALAEAAGWLKTKQLWPVLLVVAGVFLIGFLLFHHGLDKFKLVWNLISADLQQRQHLVMAVLLVIAGVAEIIFRASGRGIFQFVWPIVLGIIGVMFLVHEQHGSSEAAAWAQRIHKYLGLGLMTVSLAVLVSIIVGAKYRWLLFVWPVLLIITSLFLLAYREPEGAYHQPGATHSEP